MAHAVEEAPERQHEDVEAEVAAEERIRAAERACALTYSSTVSHEPLARGAREERDHRDDRQEQPPDQRLEHRAAGQPELVLELPEHVRRRRCARRPRGWRTGRRRRRRRARGRASRAATGRVVKTCVKPTSWNQSQSVYSGTAWPSPAEQDEAEQQPEPQPGAPQGARPDRPGRVCASGDALERPLLGGELAQRRRHGQSVARGARSRRLRRQTPASSRRSLTRFVRSQVNSGSLRPKWP